MAPRTIGSFLRRVLAPPRDAPLEDGWRCLSRPLPDDLTQWLLPGLDAVSRSGGADGDANAHDPPLDHDGDGDGDGDGGSRA